MEPAALRTLLEEVRDSHLSPDQAMHRLRHLPFEDLGFAKIDHHRPLRAGMAAESRESVSNLLRETERPTKTLAPSATIISPCSLGFRFTST